MQQYMTAHPPVVVRSPPQSCHPTYDVRRDDTVRNRCRQQQDMNCSCVDQGATLEQQAKVVMQANGRVELFFEGNPVLPGE